MNKLTRLTALLLALMMFLSTFAAADTAYQVGEMTLEQWEDIVNNAHEIVGTPTIDEGGVAVRPEIPDQPTTGGAPGGKQYLATTTADLSAGSVDATLYASGQLNITGVTADQWQINVGGNVWVNITGENGATLTVTNAMVQNLGTSVQVRQAAKPDYIANITIVEYTETMLMVAAARAASAVPAAEPQVVADEVMTLEEANQYTVIINYHFADGSPAASPYTASLGKGTPFNHKVDLPNVLGYVATVDLDTLPADVTYDSDTNQIIFKLDAVNHNVAVYVTYQPGPVNYTIIHYQQNVDNDDYTNVKSTVHTGITGDQVPESGISETPAGFYALLYERPEIAADGSTIVEIYYDRYYYLMNFELGGGYGVEPIYARYGAPVGNVGIPERAGYTFRGWSQDGSALVELPRTVPAEHREYVALWDAGETTYSVVYWRADLDDGNPATATTYSYWGQKTVASDAGVVLVPSQVGERHTAASANIGDAGYFTYQAGETAARNAQTVTVAGDGSTVINVYYSRKVYEIRFIYARERNGTKAVATLTTTGAVGAGTWTEVVEIPSVTDSRFTSKTEDIETGNWYTYYYISIEAEYGANIQDIWPAAAIGNVKDTSGNTRYWGSWAAEAGTDYRENDAEHANIVGAYPILSADMIKDPYERVAQRMTAWWGSQVDSWGAANISKHTYHIYFEALPGQKADKTYNGKGYVLVDSTEFTCAHNGSTRVDPFEYAGFTCINDTRGKKESNGDYSNLNKDSDYQKDSENYENTRANTNAGRYACPYTSNRCKYCNVFYYERNTYTLSFYNYNDESPAPADEKVKFGASISDYEPTEEPAYPVGLEAGAYEFAGWYTTPECYDGTEADWNSTMPAGDVTIYAKWTPVIYEVNFYLTETDMRNGDIYIPQKPNDDDDLPMPMPYGPAHFEVQHGSNIAPDYVSAHLDYDAMIAAKPRDPYKFVAWFYYNEQGVKTAFNPTTQVRRDMEIFAEWTSDVMVPYTIKYAVPKLNGDGSYVVDENGNWVVDQYIAADTTGSALAGISRTFNAKGGTELYPDYQAGYFPTTKSHTIEFTTDQEEAGGVEYIFWYTPATAVPYTVYYVTDTQNENSTLESVELDGMTYYIVHSTKTVSDNRKAVVTEEFEVVTGYMPDAFQKRLVVSATGENKIVFYYTKDEDHAYYQVTHWTQNIDGATWTEYSASQIQGDIDSTAYSDDQLDIDGFTYDHTEYVYDGGTYQGSPDGKHQLDEKGLQINLYYTRNKYPYIVYYREQNTTTNLIDPKRVADKLYGELVSESYVEIPGYTCVTESPQTFQIRIEEDENGNTLATPLLNVIYFYYTEDPATINYVAVPPEGGTVSLASETLKVLTGTAQGSTADPNDPTYKFVGWYKDEACTNKVDDSWVTGNKIVPKKTKDYDTTDDGIVLGYESATYYAKFDWNVGSLSIEKVVNNTNADLSEDAFTFRVTLGGVASSFSYKVVNASTGETVSDNQTSRDDGTIELKAGQKAIISNLIHATTYKVEEINLPSWYDLESSLGADAQIVAGQVAEAKFTNVYQTGSLIITKEVVGTTAPDDTFTFKLQLSEKHETYSYTKTAADGTTSADSVAYNGTVKLKKGESVTITGIPAGTSYAVEEKVDDDSKYTTAATGETGTIDANAASTAAFTNTYLYGNLTISKRIDPPPATHSPEKFTFMLELSDKQNQYTYFITDDEGVAKEPVTFSNGVCTFELEENWTLTVKDVPVGTTYKVTETPVSGYAVYVSINHQANKVSTKVAEGTIQVGTADTVNDVKFINVYGLGSLLVVKNVVGAHPDDTFTFNMDVRDKDGNVMTGIFPLVITYDKAGDMTNLEDVDISKTITFELENGWSALIAELPEGVNFTITEVADSAYTTYVNDNLVPTAEGEPYYGEKTNVITGMIPTTGMHEIAYTNVYRYSTLTITKDGMEAGESAIFEVDAVSRYNPGEKTTFTVSVPNGGSVTIRDLLINSEYTITEIDSWSNRYDKAETVNGKISKDGSEVKISNTGKNNQWLHDEDYVHNNFSKPGDYANN